MANKPTRCNGCGKPFEEGEDLSRVAEGQWRAKKGKTAFVERKGWGLFHMECFLQSTNTLSAVEEAIKKQVRR